MIKHFKLFLACALMLVLGFGQMWATVESGTTYGVKAAASFPDDWTYNGGFSTGGGGYIQLTAAANYIQTDEFCQNGFTSIVVKARKVGGPDATQAEISVDWWEDGATEPVTLGTISPSSTTLTNLTISSPADVTVNRNGYIKISCKGASSSKGSGVSEVTISYEDGSCGSTKTLSSVTVSGDPTKTSYETSEKFDPAGLTVTGTYSDATSGAITSGITWEVRTDGESATTALSSYTLTAGQTSLQVRATASEIASAWYTISGLTVVTGPDVTLNLIDGNWGFPTSNTTGTETYTNSVSGYSVTCYAPTNYKDASTYFFLGKEGAYIELPAFPNPIEKIVIAGNSNGAADVAWNIFKGDDAVSTAASGCKEDAYTFNIDPLEANVAYRIKVTSAKNLQIKTIKIYYGTAPAVAKPTISGDENFVTSTTVTISHADADHIYYTTDGTDPTTSSTLYEGSFSLNATATVKAIAVKGSDESQVAEKEFTKVTALSTMADVQAAATSSETAINVSIANWVVTAVSGSQVWMAAPDNLKGILLYKSGHGFVAGNKLNGLVVGTKIKLYNDYPELTSLVAGDVAITTADAITARTTTIADLTSGHPAEQGTIVKLEDLTYTAASTSFSDGVNTIQIDSKLYSPALVDGATYTITGVVEYLASSVVKIMPRSVDDVEQTSGGGLPEVDGLAELKAEATGASYLVNLTDAVVTLVSGNNAFIEDATAGALIFYSGHGLVAGDKLNGQYEVTTATYQGKFEITAMEAQTGAEKTSGAEIPVTTLTIAQLNANFAANESKRIKIVGANVTDAISGSDRNGAINDGAALAVYAGVASTITLAENDNVDIIGYPGFHNSDQQLTVWAQADITVNEKADPEISYSPATLTIEEGDAWSAPTFNNPHSLAIASYVSSNEAVATVSDGGVIALAGGIGTAVITAHTNGDATYAAGNATYTITVNEAGSYSMSINLSKASYDDAADEEVVWNSNVVTFTADKNDGTKVTNYLAGNYSSGTLIEEVRFYAKNSLSFVPASGVTITKVEWMSTAKGYATKLAAETWTNATAAVDATNDKLVNITPSAAGEFSVTLTDAARATGITVYYQADAEKAKLTASIAIDDMNMAVGDDDILLSAIAATSNPNKKAISYAVTSGTAVSIVGEGAEAALHAVEEGEATITATIPDNLGNYTGATKTFTVTVAAAATLVSIAIDGTATELEYTEGQSFNPAGLTVMGHYSDNSDAEITSGITWTFDPDPLTEGTTSISVTATVETISSDAFVVNGLTVSGPAPVGDNYVKVTASQTDWSGDYILVYEDGTNAYVWNGDYSDGASNYASATISSNTIAKPAAAAVITIAAASTEGKYTLQVNGDKYFQDNGSNAKLIFTDAIADAAEVTISYETDWTKLLFSERCIRFNSTAGQTRFRFYGESNQQAVQLYKKDVPTPAYTDIRTGLTAGNYYTVCWPKAMTAIKGGTLWSFAGKDASMAYLVQQTAPFVAGRPYIIYATDTKLEAVVEGDDATAGNYNGLYGTLSYMDADALSSAGATYMLKSNELRPIGTNNHLDANRAYVILDNITGGKPAGVPAHMVRSMPLKQDTTTGMDNLNASETPVKVMINGQMYILRGEKMYNANGQLVK